MATLLELTFESGSQGTGATAANTANGAYQFTAMDTTGTFDAASAHHGSYGILTSSAAASCYGYLDFSSKTVSYRLAFKFIGSIPTSDFYMIRVGVGATRYGSVHLNTAGKLRVSDATGTTGVWTSTNTLVADTWYWMQGAFGSGTATNDGTIKFDYYTGWSTTPAETGYSVTNANAGAGVTYTRAYMMKYGAIANQVAFDDVMLTDTTTVPGQYTPSATSPIAPISVYDNSGAWTLTGSGVYTHEQALKDSSDTTYAVSPGSTTNEQVTYRLPPLAAGNVAITYRAYLPSGSTATQIKAELLEGATVRATQTSTLTSSAADYTLTLTPTENSNISDRTNLRLRLTGNPA